LGQGVVLEDLCFEAQQAAEKSIKAVMIARGIAFPYTHDLAKLIDILDNDGEVIPQTIREAGRLTPYAMVTRYPGPAKAVTESQYEKAIAVADAVVAWAAEQIQPTNRTTD
jgi:HEPN domain-containing protein